MSVTHLVAAASPSAISFVVSHSMYLLVHSTRPESISLVHADAFPPRRTSTLVCVRVREADPGARTT